MLVPRVVVVASAIAIVVLVLLVSFLVLRAALVPTDAVYVASNPHWGTCTQAGQDVHCTAIATVTNQGGTRIARVQWRSPVYRSSNSSKRTYKCGRNASCHGSARGRSALPSSPGMHICRYQ